MSRGTSQFLAVSVITAPAVGGALLSGVGTAYAAAGTDLLPRAALNCQARAAVDAELHLLPDADGPVRGYVPAGTVLNVVDTASSADGSLWFRLDNGLYVRASLTKNLICVLEF